jgi:single-strand DNA-binding protein
MILIALARLGKDAELRHAPSGEQVCNLALAMNYGRKGDDGNRPTQWVDASLWGKRVEALAPHLTKGKLLYVVLEEPHIETYEGKNGTGSKLVARVLNLEFAGGKLDDIAGQSRQAAQPRQSAPKPAAAPQSSGGFGDFDSEVPFDRFARSSWRGI